MPAQDEKGKGREDSGVGTAGLIRPGTTVVLRNLKSEKGKLLNGRLGVVQIRGEEGSEYMCVRLHPEHAETNWKRILIQNLQPIKVDSCYGCGQVCCRVTALAQASVLQEVFSGLHAESLCRFRACNKQCLVWDATLAAVAWQVACSHLWGSKASRFHLTDNRRAELQDAFPKATWCHLYHNQLAEIREPLNSKDLSSLHWAFNFTKRAGSAGLATAQIVCFEATDASRGFLHMMGYPALPYCLHGSVLDIANFPPHTVVRLQSWEWLISNANVVFISGKLLDVEGQRLSSQHLQHFPDVSQITAGHAYDEDASDATA